MSVILAILLIAILWIATRLKSNDKLVKLCRKPRSLTQGIKQNGYFNNSATNLSIYRKGISPTTFNKLVKMVYGRKDLARKLVEKNLKLYPDRSAAWACRKAISDLERERRL